MRNLFRIVLGGAGAIFLMVVLASVVELRDDDLLGLTFNASWAAVALLGYFPCALLRAMRMRHFASQTFREQGLAKMTSVLVTHQAANHILPMKLGEFVYPLLIRALGRDSVAKGIGTTILMRFADLLGLGCVVCLAAGFASDLSVPVRLSYAVGGFVTALIALLLLDRGDRVFLWGCRVLGPAVPAFLERVSQDLGAALGAMDKSAPTWIFLVGESVLLWGGLVGLHCALGCAFGLCLPPELMALGALGSVLSGYLPIGTLLNLGTVELGWVATLPFVGVAARDALLYGTAIHLSLVCMTAIYATGALVYLQRMRRS